MNQECDTGEWLKFFLDASLPKESAEIYAVIFSKNHMKLDMLPEITKEYLVDMGISLVGHIIAILRHAKTVHGEAVTRAALLKTENSPTSTTKQVDVKTNPTLNKPLAARMLDHYIGKGSSGTGMMDEQSKQPVNNKIEIKCTVNNMKRCTRKLSTDEGVVTKKVRRVSPEEEGSYKVIMPRGITERSRKILSKREEIIESKKSPVFERLGNKSGGVVIIPEVIPKTEPDGIFNRLGVATQDPLPYAGILKSPKSPHKAVPERTMHADRPVASVHSRTKRPSLESRLSKLSFTVENSSSPGLKSSVRERLGNVQPVKNNTPSKTVIGSLQENGSESRRKVKRVSFGMVSQQFIPKEENSMELRGSLGMGTGVFSRLGIL